MMWERWEWEEGEVGGERKREGGEEKMGCA